MVGDEDQSIYGFRAAYPEALMQFERTYPNARVKEAQQNIPAEVLEADDVFRVSFQWSRAGNATTTPQMARELLQPSVTDNA